MKQNFKVVSKVDLGNGCEDHSSFIKADDADDAELKAKYKYIGDGNIFYCVVSTTLMEFGGIR